MRFTLYDTFQKLKHNIISPHKLNCYRNSNQYVIQICIICIQKHCRIQHSSCPAEVPNYVPNVQTLTEARLKKRKKNHVNETGQI